MDVDATDTGISAAPVQARPDTLAPLRSTYVRTALALGLTLGLTRPAASQAPHEPRAVERGKSASGTPAGEKPEEAEGSEAEELARDSPRASIADFFALCRSERFQDAALYLDLPNELEARGPQLAQRLKAVLDRKAEIDVGKLSALATGNVDDDLPRLTDEIGRVSDEDGRPEPVRVARRNRQGVRWVFTQTTVGRVDAWYSGLSDHFVLEHFPPWLLRAGPKGLLRWQWGALPLLLAAAWTLGYALSRLSVAVISRIARTRSTDFASQLALRLSRPLTLAWGLAVAYLLLPWLELYGPAEDYVLGIMHVSFLVFVFWMLSRLLSVFSQGMARSPWALRNPSSRSLIPLGRRVGHVALVGVATVAVLSQLGYPVASLIAGLGVGGLAVALAAQKTLENLFGAFAIGADQPFREGDAVQAEGFSGTVESVGLRSTKLRTADRTLVTVPNGKLADMRIESLAARDRLRFVTTLSLSNGTRTDQIRNVLSGLSELLSSQPKLWRDGRYARLVNVGAEAIEIEVAAYFDTLDNDEFLKLRENFLLALLTVVEQAGASLAVPRPNVWLEDARAKEKPVAKEQPGALRQ